MSRVLILFAHPNLQSSRVHRRLIERVPALPDVTFHDLYEAYPRLDIDIEREQALMEDHDVVVQAHRSAQKFIRHDEAAVAELAKHRDKDQATYIGFARSRIQWLEELLLADLAESADRDRGWDPETLREEARGGRPARSEPEDPASV